MKIAFNETSEVQLHHPISGEPLFADEAKKKPLVAVVYGAHSQYYTGKFEEAVKKRNSQKEDERLSTKEAALDLLVSAVKEFKNCEELDVGNGPVDQTDIRGMLSIFWVKRDVERGINDLNNFLQ